MADNKYGRIFTEQDVVEILSHANPDISLGEILENVDPGDLKFPADEPLFLIRAQDQLAPQAVTNYLSMSQANGVNSDQQELVARTVNDIKSFQRDNAGKVKLPD